MDLISPQLLSLNLDHIIYFYLAHLEPILRIEYQRSCGAHDVFIVGD